MSDELLAMTHGLPAGVSTPSSSSFSPARAMAYGAAGHGAAAAIDAGVSLLMSRYEQRQQKRLMQQQFKLQREMTKTQMSDMRESYERAGLSPALLANGGFSPAQVDAPSPAMQNVSGKHVDTTAVAQQKVLAATLAEQNATVQNIEAQTAGQELKNDEQAIVNSRLRSEDSDSDDYIRIYMNQVISALPEGDLKDNLNAKYNNSDWTFNKGDMSAASNFLSIMQQHSDYGADYSKNARDKAVYDAMRNDPSIISAMAGMPKLEVAKADAFIREVSSVISRNLSDVLTNVSQQDVNRALAAKLGGDLRRINYDIESSQLGDSRYLLKHGRGADLVANVFMNGAEISGDVLKMYLGGRGFAAGRSAGSFEGNPPPIVSPTARKSAEKLPKVSDIARGQRYTAKELASIPLDQRKKMAQIEFNIYRYEHSRMGDESLRKMHEKIGAKYGIFRNPQNRLRK